MERKLILVAEDEPDTAHLIGYHLQRAGYDVLLATDGLTALNRVFEQSPALLVLDRMLPQMDGLEVCRLIKSSPVTQRTRILMLTAMAALENKLEGFRNGADDYLTKPFDVRELVARVKAFLERRTEGCISLPAVYRFDT